MKFPSEFGTKVDLTKVNWDTMKPWIAKRITELLGGLEDEVLIAYVYEQLDNKKVGQAGRLWEGSCFTMQVPVQA
jgi:serine/arginine repetitive matrix protein 1